MSRSTLRFLILVLVVGASWLFGRQRDAGVANSAPPLLDKPASASAPAVAGDVRRTWGRPETLPDHFARHGADFLARNDEEYAAKAHAFLAHAKAAGLPAKRDHDGSLRIYEAATDTFAAYNANGTTKTFFKPGSHGYFERQPGEPVDLRSLP